MSEEETRESITLIHEKQKIFGVFHKPIQLVTKCPAVLMCHGFAGSKSGRFRFYVEMAEALSKAGIASFRFDYRGSGDSEGDFSSMTLKGEVSDSQLAYDFLAKDPDVDPNRIGVLGRSLGAIIALLTAERKKVKSLALFAPLFHTEDWKKKFEALKSEKISEEEKTFLKTIEGEIPNQTFIEEFFSLNIQNTLKKLENIPLLHIHGQLDQVIPFYHAKEYQKAREQVLAKTEFLFLEKSDHSFSFKDERKKALEKTLLWFKNTL